MKLTDVIKPSDIDTSPSLHWFGAFGKMEREISARWIVRFCQSRGNWEPFTYENVERFYNDGGYEGFVFNGLIDPGYGIRQDGDLYHIENEFVRRVCKWLIGREDDTDEITHPH